MAVRFLSYDVADLCLGKPPLLSLCASATVAEALAALKSADENFISVWNCDHSKKSLGGGDETSCVCVGKICMVDIICHLCKGENLSSLDLALKSPVSVLLTKVKGLVRHVEPSSSLLEVIDLILQGAQNLVVPIKNNIQNLVVPISNNIPRNFKRNQHQKLSTITPTLHNGQEFCWLTQEDVIRFLLSSIGLFSPVPMLSINALGIISHDILSVNYHSPVSSAVAAISLSLADQTSVAVVNDEGILIGEISPFTLSCCDETVAAAIMTLSAGDLMAYIDRGGPPKEILRVVQAGLKERKLEGILEKFMIRRLENRNLGGMVEEFIITPYSFIPTSDEELSCPTTLALSRSGRYSRASSYSARLLRRPDAIVCHPESSLVAVMIQAIAHRVNYVWVIEDDFSVFGIVTFAKMLEVFHEKLESMI